MTVDGRKRVGSGERAQVRRLRAGLAAARADDLFLYAAALAFYGLISVAPLVVVALWVTSLVVGPAEVHHVADDLARLAPPALGADRALVEVARLGTTLGLTALAVALWPATAYGTALVRVLDRMGGDRTIRGLRQRESAETTLENHDWLSAKTDIVSWTDENLLLVCRRTGA